MRSVLCIMVFLFLGIVCSCCCDVEVWWYFLTCLLSFAMLFFTLCSVALCCKGNHPNMPWSSIQGDQCFMSVIPPIAHTAGKVVISALLGGGGCWHRGDVPSVLLPKCESVSLIFLDQSSKQSDCWGATAWGKFYCMYSLGGGHGWPELTRGWGGWWGMGGSG